MKCLSCGHEFPIEQHRDPVPGEVFQTCPECKHDHVLVEEQGTPGSPTQFLIALADPGGVTGTGDGGG